MCYLELLLHFEAVCQQFSPLYLTRMIILWFGLRGHGMVSWISCQPRQHFHHWVLSPVMTLFLYKSSCFAPFQPSQPWEISINRPKKLQVTPALRKLLEGWNSSHKMVYFMLYTFIYIYNFKNENKFKKNNGTYYEFFKKYFSLSYI